MDLSGSTGSVALTLDYQTLSYFSGLYSSMRVLVNGTVLSDVNGVSWHSDAALTTLTYDLSAYAGEPNLYVAFHSNDNGFWASGWAIDDVFITFAARDIERIVHYELTELGEWVISAPKEEVLAAFPGGIPYEMRVDIDQPLFNGNRPVELDAFKVYRSENSVSDFEEIAEVGVNIQLAR